MAKADRWKNLALLASTLILCGLVAELALRVFWKDGQYAFRSYQSAPYLFPIKYWKTWHYAEDRVHFVKDCLDVNYTTNSLGMRGKEISAEDTRERIALLGDSYVEGYAVNDNQTIGSYLETLLNKKYEVMNFGVSGGFGTIHEVALYHNYARHFNPAYLVLFFVNYNDLYDNVNAVGDNLINGDLEITYPIADFEEVQSALALQNSAAHSLQSGSTPYLFRFVSRSLRIIGASFQYWWNIRTDLSQALVDVYAEPESDAVRKGWIITRASLARLNALTAENHARILVVSLADAYQTDVNWLKMASLRSGKGKTIDPRHPNERLRQMCADLQIEYYDMYDDVLSYIQSRKLRFPYLSYACDRHYNKEGNSLVAKLVAQKLRAVFGIG